MPFSRYVPRLLRVPVRRFLKTTNLRTFRQNRHTPTLQKVRGLVELGFVVPPYDGMQNYGRMKFLHECIVKYATRRSGVALEIGCFQCCSTIFLAKACIRRGIDEIYAMDLFTGTPSWNMKIDSYKTACARLGEYQLDEHVTLIRAHSLEYNWHKMVDVLHIDADHEYDAVRSDIAKYAPLVSPSGLLIFDDYDVSHPGVKRAVNELLLDSEEYEIVAVNYEGQEYGSICIRKSPRL